jgi:NAD(P)-dependent dehydrogenase (short-subunit alcohol dehydrogenase family)
MTKSVLITGASTGIGRACALHLDRLGWQVFASVRKESDAQDLRRESGECLTPVYLDVTDPDSIARTRGQIEGIVGEAGLDGLVNNAGVARAGPVEFVPLEDYQLTMQVNVFGVIAVTQAFIPALRTAQGRIANISSVSGLIASPFMSPYSASKFALEALSDSLRVELRPWRIQVAVIEPGNIHTPIWDKSLDAIYGSKEHWPDQVDQLYQPALDTFAEVAMSRRGIPAVRVAQAVEHALTASRPRLRYRVGRDAQLVGLLRLLPRRVIDWLISGRLPRYPE